MNSFCGLLETPWKYHVRCIPDVETFCKIVRCKIFCQGCNCCQNVVNTLEIEKNKRRSDFQSQIVQMLQPGDSEFLHSQPQLRDRDFWCSRFALIFYFQSQKIFCANASTGGFWVSPPCFPQPHKHQLQPQPWLELHGRCQCQLCGNYHNYHYHAHDLKKISSEVQEAPRYKPLTLLTLLKLLTLLTLLKLLHRFGAKGLLCLHIHVIWLYRTLWLFAQKAIMLIAACSAKSRSVQMTEWVKPLWLLLQLEHLRCQKINPCSSGCESDRGQLGGRVQPDHLRLSGVRSVSWFGQGAGGTKTLRVIYGDLVT